MDPGSINFYMKEAMKPQNLKIVPFGEVVAAVFDHAEKYGRTPQETARLASLAVMHLWSKNRQPPVSALLSTTTMRAKLNDRIAR